MDTIMIMAKALQQAAGANMRIDRLDFQYNKVDEQYHARLWLQHEKSGVMFKYDINEDGTVSRVTGKEN